MTLFFQSNNISKEWERIKMALGKIKGEKDNQAQQWTDTQIRKFLPFQREQKGTSEELDILTMTNKPPFKTQEKMIDEMAQFFISTETQTHTIVSQISFGHISINSLTILTVLKAMESPQKDLLINASHVLRQSIMAEILSRSTGNHHITIY